MNPNLLPTVLCIQILLIFFIPPLALGNRHIFASDIWCFLWVIAYFPSLFKKYKSFFLYSALLFFFIYAHGYFRVPISLKITWQYSYNFGELDHFQPLRELVVMLRFLSWLWAAGASFILFSKMDTSEKWLGLERIYKTLSFSVSVVFITMCFSRVSPSFSQWLGSVYHYNPDFHFWKGRMYGVFQSPVEAGAALSFATLLLTVSSSKLLSLRLRILSSFASGAGTLLSKTATALFSLLVAVCVRLSEKKRFRKWVLVVCGISLAFIGAVYFLEHKTFVTKLNDLQSRFDVWSVYLKYAFYRWDFFLFGYGFTNYHIDNAYVYTFNRAGIVGLIFLLYGLGVFCNRNWKFWNYSQRSLLVFFIILSLGLDAFILRHTVVLLFAVMSPTLATKSR